MKSLSTVFVFGIILVMAAGMSGINLLGGFYHSFPITPGTPIITKTPTPTTLPLLTPTPTSGIPAATPTPITPVCVDCQPDGCWPINVARRMVSLAQNVNPGIVESAALGKATQALCREKQKRLPETPLSDRLATYGFAGSNVQEFADLVNVTSCGADLGCQAQTAWDALKTTYDLETKLRSGDFNRIGTGHCGGFWSVILGKE